MLRLVELGLELVLALKLMCMCKTKLPQKLIFLCNSYFDAHCFLFSFSGTECMSSSSSSSYSLYYEVDRRNS